MEMTWKSKEGTDIYRTRKSGTHSSELETVSLGAGDLEFHKTGNGTLGVEDSIYRFILCSLGVIDTKTMLVFLSGGSQILTS